jgi:hypothetical protein
MDECPRGAGQVLLLARFEMRILLMLMAGAIVACGRADGTRDGAWDGTVDTLPTGHVVVRNTARGIWPEGGGWRVEEDLRIGRIEGDGPDVFGRIRSFTVDDGGRIWVLEQQAQELRVFDGDGAHVRTVGRRGGGPGEFAQAMRVERGPDGHMWVMDPQNNRLSVFDTAGIYLLGRPAAGGFIMHPWPGRADTLGNYYSPVPHGGRLALVRHDAEFTPRDTMQPPRDPVQRERFEVRGPGGGGIVAGVPYQGGLVWRLSERGTFLGLMTDEYRLFEIDAAGDTLRTVTRAYSPLSVTAADRERARDELKWFTDQGGQIDLAMLPRTKPPAASFFVDDEGNTWVELVAEGDDAGRLHDVFDAHGRLLGTLRLPFALQRAPFPMVRDRTLYGVTEDELGVQYVVRARIVGG